MYTLEQSVIYLVKLFDKIKPRCFSSSARSVHQYLVELHINFINPPLGLLHLLRELLFHSLLLIQRLPVGQRKESLETEAECCGVFWNFLLVITEAECWAVLWNSVLVVSVCAVV